MLNTLALAALLSVAPGETGELRLTNVRATYGLWGAKRATEKVIPGDIYFLAFDIENLKVSADGKVTFSQGMELLDANGKPVFKADPQEVPTEMVLGGSTAPSSAHASIGSDTQPGEYTFRVTVTDSGDKRKATLTRKFTVVPREFGLVRIFYSFDEAGAAIAPHIGVTGQNYWINFTVGNFKRDAKKQPSISFEMTVLDSDDKPTLDKPISGDLGKDVPADAQYLPVHFLVPLNRPGKYTLQLQATDQIAKKTTKVSLPLTVIDNK